ncbi:hypothetical protein RhiirA4_477029 [Rhizophagus irregularis]|uniref:Uncharacterized protein n=1 Tax=Rhizophagus irregularis TaxID=588596 RepID=A0A2I1HCM1_9GLOM|nr:hypothetical protein RhiirA4_477029 [Rhizophagus irregularis]
MFTISLISESDELDLNELVSEELLSDELDSDELVSEKLLSDDELDSDELLLDELDSNELVSGELDLSGILVKDVKCFWSLSIFVRRSLTHLQAFQFKSNALSSSLYSLNYSGVDLADRPYFSKNCSKNDLKLLVLVLFRAFGITFVISILIISRLLESTYMVLIAKK